MGIKTVGIRRGLGLTALLPLIATLPACGGGGSAGGSSAGSSGSSGNSYISWSNSANGTTILDAKNNQFAAESSSGAVVSLATNATLPNLTVTGTSLVYNGATIGSVSSATSSQNTTVAVFDCTNGTGLTLTVSSTTQWSYRCGIANAYVANSDGTISQYNIAATGDLTPISPATVATANSAAFIAADPTGSYLYVTDSGGTLWQYDIGESGALTPMNVATVASGSYPAPLVVDPAGANVVVEPGVALSQSGQYAYVLNNGSGTVAQYAVATGGALTPLNPATVTFPNGGPPATSPANQSSVQAIAIDTTGKFLYLAGTYTQFNGYTQPEFTSFGAIWQYAIGSSGELTLVGGGAELANRTDQLNSLAIDPLGSYVYATGGVSNGSPAGVTAAIAPFYTDGTTGTLSPISSQINFASGATALALDPSGKFVYGVNPTGNTVLQFIVGSSGVLEIPTTSSVAAGNRPIGLVITQ